ncbi:MAG TPA: YggT family protein [Candidatus Elarobacter sp.]|jgi:YggT family protein
MVPCFAWDLLRDFFLVYLLLMLIYAVVSWVPSLRGRWTDYLAMVIEPVLTPVRRIIPPLGGLDISYLIVFIVLQFVLRLIASNAAAQAC